MSHSQDATDPSERECSDIMPWLLAIAEVVNSGGRLTPQKGTRKMLRDWVDTYGPETCWRGLKHFSKTFGMANAPDVEALFQSHPHLPNLLKTGEGQRIVSQWFNDNSATVDQARRVFHALGKLVPITITSKFTEGEVTPEHKKILGEVFQILGKERNDEEGRTLC